MELTITDFLPKYPNIHKETQDIFNPYSSEDFQNVLYHKKEFYDERLNSSEDIPETGSGILLKHQKLISRFMSSHTIYNGILLLHEMGCVAPNTLIPCFDGTVKRADEVVVGDVLIGDDGTPRNVLRLIQGQSEMYEVTQKKAVSYTVNGNHILTLKISGNHALDWSEKTMTWTLRWFDKTTLKARAKTKKCMTITKAEGYQELEAFKDTIIEDNILEITVADYMNLSKTVRSYLKGYKCSGVHWDKRKVSLDPYILGMWIGDGNSRDDGFTSADSELVEVCEEWAEKNNSIIKKHDKYEFWIQNQARGASPFKSLLREYNLVGNKHIPDEYTVNDRDTRLQLLAGIIDADGHVYADGTCVEIAQKNVNLSNQIAYLARSLGFYCSQKTHEKWRMYKGERETSTFQIITIVGKYLDDIPTRVPHKKISQRCQVKDPLNTQISIASVGNGSYFGWEISGNCRFLLEDFTVTHNTGKTCSAVGVAEQIRMENNGFRRVLVLAKGPGLIRNFKKELVEKCTSGQYRALDTDLSSKKDILLQSIVEDVSEGLPGTHTGIMPLGGSGTDLVVTVILERPDKVSSILVTSSGSEYVPGDLITIDASELGDNSTAVEIVLTADNFGGNLTEGERERRTSDRIAEYYSFNTFQVMAKDLAMMSKEEVRDRYSNYVIIIDEVHNISDNTPVEDDEGDTVVKKKMTNTYKQIWEFLHTVQGCKVLLMSGTPMTNEPNDLAGIMNLILPKNEQMPTGEAFAKTFTKDQDGVISIRKSKRCAFKSYLKGRISYLGTSRENDVRMVFEGGHSGNLTMLNVVDDYMGDFQTKSYDSAYARDIDGKGVYTHSRQASLFVYPDGTYGPDGFDQERYIKRVERAIFVQTAQGPKKRTATSYELGDALVDAIKSDTDEEMLENLEYYSSKYAATIAGILENVAQGKSGFIFCEFVKGSGAILFALILRLFGFRKATGIGDKDKALRYALVTNATSTRAGIQRVIDRFNQPDNLHGEYISVIIGSSVISEGFTLKNVQTENVLTPWFNYAVIAQSIARGYRLGSHINLLQEGGPLPIVQVFQRVSMPASTVPSIDLMMYEISEVKDISIKRVERLVQEAAFDCPLTYDRNWVDGMDNTRECNYTSCAYKCDGMPNDMLIYKNGRPMYPYLDDDELDYSTSQLYYAKKEIDDIIVIVTDLFRSEFVLSLVAIQEQLPEHTDFNVISALQVMINESHVIINRYGLPSYLREENDIYYLIDSLSVIGGLTSEYYTRNPSVATSDTFGDVAQKMYIKSLPDIIQRIAHSTTMEEMRLGMSRLPLQLQQSYLESCILAQELGVTKSKTSCQLVLDFFKHDYREVDGTWMVWLMYDETETEPSRCLIDGEWQDCTDEQFEELLKDQENVVQELETNPYGYFGRFNRETDKFCIVDATIPKDTADGRKEHTGRVCIQSWPNADLTNLIVKVMKIPAPASKEYDDKSKKTLWDDMLVGVDKMNERKKTTEKKEKKGGKKGGKEKKEKKIVKAKVDKNALFELYKPSDYKNLSTEQVRSAAYWSNQRRDKKCDAVRKWFEENGLMSQYRKCGESSGKRGRKKADDTGAVKGVKKKGGKKKNGGKTRKSRKPKAED
jgi:hypothetical protein